MTCYGDYIVLVSFYLGLKIGEWKSFAMIFHRLFQFSLINCGRLIWMRLYLYFNQQLLKQQCFIAIYNKDHKSRIFGAYKFVCFGSGPR